MLLSEYAIEWWFVIPPLLTNVSALPWETWTPETGSFQSCSQWHCFGLLYLRHSSTNFDTFCRQKGHIMKYNVQIIIISLLAIYVKHQFSPARIMTVQCILKCSNMIYFWCVCYSYNYIACLRFKGGETQPFHEPRSRDCSPWCYGGEYG